VLKLKGGVRNVSMQLFDWGRETLSEDSRIICDSFQKQRGFSVI